MRVNLTVFECRLKKIEYDRLLAWLKTVIHKRQDILIVYPLCMNCMCAVRSLGRLIERRDDEVLLSPNLSDSPVEQSF